MEENEYKKLSKIIPDEILARFGIKVIKTGSGRILETENANDKEHIERLASILTVSAILYENALVLSLSMGEKNDGFVAVNSIRQKTTQLMGNIADSVLENYVDNKTNFTRKDVENGG